MSHCDQAGVAAMIGMSKATAVITVVLNKDRTSFSRTDWDGSDEFTI